MSTSLAKGVNVLGVLATAAHPMSVRDVASVSGLSKSTVHRLLCELNDAGGVVRTEPRGTKLVPNTL